MEHIYAVVRSTLPDASEEIYYALLAFKYKKQGLIAFQINADFISLYPFCALERPGLDLSSFD